MDHRKSDRRMGKTTKKSKIVKKTADLVQTKLQMEAELLRSQKLTNLKTYALTTMKKDLTNEEILLDFLDILFPTGKNQYPLTALMVIIFVVCPQSVIDVVIHPKKWMSSEIQKI
ncbi:unnamed protein product [Macrosiphum euphorbiae]|uniref:Uncharacterized protein n=1 Tax=Macrosiphum euphorbiae TaxID=13131 RepID=A0AAV0Y5R3_9HEMI|nr:unnamed protein product [Macrosiphum euphorbiae]